VKKVTLKAGEGKEGEVISMDETTLKDKSTRDVAKKALKGVFMEGFEAFEAKKEGKGKVGEHYFYSKLRF